MKKKGKFFRRLYGAFNLNDRTLKPERIFNILNANICFTNISQQEFLVGKWFILEKNGNFILQKKDLNHSKEEVRHIVTVVNTLTSTCNVKHTS